MTETEIIEERLRRTFRAVAGQPVGTVVVDLEPRAGTVGRVSIRRTGLLIAAVVVLVVGVGAVALVYGPRSAAPGTPSRLSEAAGHRDRFAATFITTRRASARQIAEDARIVTRRLAFFGDGADSAVVRGRSVVIVGRRRLPVPASVLAASGTVLFRPVLCVSAPSTPPAPGITAALRPPSSCSATIYSVRSPNLTVDPSTGSSNETSIRPDPELATTRSSTPSYDETHPGSPVLVPTEGHGDRGGDGGRYLLGPAELSGTAVSSAVTTFHTPQWEVDVDFTAAGSARWDAVAHENFHQMIAVDFDGQVVTAPLIEPNQAQFTSFAGRMDISGAFTARSARALAAVLNSGPLPAPLVLVTSTTVPPGDGGGTDAAQ
jgi:preprotein translocase subunit SecD